LKIRCQEPLKIRFSAHAIAQPCKHSGSKAFQALQRPCGIYTILNLDCC